MPNNQSSDIWKVLQDDVPHPLRGQFGWPRSFSVNYEGGGSPPRGRASYNGGGGGGGLVGGNNGNNGGGGPPPNLHVGFDPHNAPYLAAPGPPMMNGQGGFGQFNNGGGGNDYARPAWAGPPDQAKAMALPTRLPPMEMDPVFRSFAMPEPPQPSRLDPIHMAGAMAAAQMAQASSSRSEERIMMLEQRTINAERAAQEVGRAFDLQNARVMTLGTELTRGAAEVNDLRMRYDQSMAANTMLQQQVAAIAGELRNYDNRLQGTSAQLSEAQHINADMRGQMSRMGDELARGAQERSATTTAVERLGHALAMGTQAVAEDSRRALEEANAAYRQEAGRRQDMHLMELGALNRDVEMFRQEAAGAGAALRDTIERVNARLHSEEAQLDRLRNEAAATASAEAQQLGGVRGQVGELQNVLNSMGQQLQAEQGARRQDAEMFDGNLRTMEAAMLQAQDAIVQRTITLMEGKAQQFMRQFQDLDAKTADRDEETRAAGEQQLVAFVKGSAKKERAGLERVLVLESAMRDVAAAAQQSLSTLNERINSGMMEVTIAQAEAKRSNEERESALRDQINAALQKIRAYARDMEESLEQERIKLEEVVKLEIKARLAATEAIKEEMAEAVTAIDRKVEGLLNAQRAMLAAQRDMLDAAEVMRQDILKVTDDVTVKIVKQMAQINTELGDIKDMQVATNKDMEAEIAARQDSDNVLHNEMQALVGDFKATEDALRAEIDTLAIATQANLDHEMQHMAGELNKMQTGIEAGQREVEALAALVASHGEVFVDVARKLESQEQKTRTVEVQVAALYEQADEKFAALATKQKELAKEITTTREDMHTTLTNKLLEQDEKLARHQNVMEDVLAQVQEEMATNVTDLTAKIEHSERLMEDQSVRLEQYADDQAAKASALCVGAIGLVAEEVDTKLKHADERLAEATDRQAAALAAAVSGQQQEIEETKSLVATAVSMVQDGLAQAQANIEAVVADAAALHTEVSAALKQQGDAMSTQLQAQEDRMGHQVADVEERVAGLVERAVGQLVQLKEETDASHATTQASLAKLDETTSAALAAAVEDLNGRVVEARTSTQDLSKQMATALISMQDAMSHATADMAEKGDALQKGLDNGFQAMQHEVESRMEEQEKHTQALVAASADAMRHEAAGSDLQGAVQALQQQVAERFVQQAQNAEVQQHAIDEAATALEEGEKKALSRQKAVLAQQEEFTARIQQLEHSLGEVDTLHKQVNAHNGQLATLQESSDKLASDLSAHSADIDKRLENTHAAVMITAQSSDSKFNKVSKQQADDYDALSGMIKGQPSADVLNGIVNSRLAEARIDLNRTFQEQIAKQHQMVMDNVGDSIKTKVDEITSNMTKKMEERLDESSQDTITKVADAATAMLNQQMKTYKDKLGTDVYAQLAGQLHQALDSAIANEGAGLRGALEAMKQSIRV